MFVLPVGGGSGGAHSVMQEADAMWRLGVPVAIASNTDNAARLRRAYREMERIHQHIYAYGNPAELRTLIEDSKVGVAVATTNHSVHILADAIQSKDSDFDVKAAYYIQDYEPLFYARESDDWLKAYSSFDRIPGLVCFAKTRWLQEVVENNHRVKVHKVEASIDHRVYYPDLPSRDVPKEKTSIVAMLRPGTPRRAPRRTVRLLHRLLHQFGDRISCITFGCHMAELDGAALRLDGIEHLGVLTRAEVGDLFRSVDLFLDLSDYQAFGRTAVEAMSCGAVGVVPAHGGVHEFAQDGVNSFIVDTRDDDLIVDAVDAFLSMADHERREMMMAAIETGYRYNSERAALSELSLLLG